jgi:creatinine amidohydrolase
MPGDADDPSLSCRSWTEMAPLLSDPSRPAIALLPVGSTEPHGPHLPLDTDVIISVETARRAAARLRAAGLGAFVLPPLAYTVTEFSRDFAGAVGVSPATMRALVGDVCEAALAQGFAAVCLVNSHLEPDHLAALRDTAAAVSARAGRPVVFPDKTRRRWSATLTPEFRSGACHAGQYETSLVMAARPDLVDEAARRALPPNPISIGRRIKEGARTFREAGSDQAYFGDPAAASAAEGETTFDALATMIVTEVLEVLGR